MDKKQMPKEKTGPTTKEEALRYLGVRTKKKTIELAGQVEFVHVRAGRQLLRLDSFAPTVLVGVAGSAMVSNRDGHVVELEAPYVLDSWASNSQRLANVTAVAAVDSALVLVDWRYRDTVFASAPALVKHSVQTRNSVELAMSRLIDLTEDSSPMHSVK